MNPSSVSTQQQAGKIKEDIPGLKNRLAELERQANEYKTKLDELRRAKATTTVVKCEKEYVNTTVPGTSRTEKIKCEKCDELEEMLDTEKRSNAQLKKLADQKDSNKKPPPPPTTTTSSGPCSKCPTSQEFLDDQKENNAHIMDQILDQEKLTEVERNAKELFDRNFTQRQSQLVEVKHRCDKLQKENQEYHNACEKMRKEYADKMAQLCRQEEEAKRQVATWEQMYTEWMAKMEKRVTNLQVTNQEFNHDHDEHSHRRGGAGNQRR